MLSPDPDLLSALLDVLVPPQPERNLAGAGRPAVTAYVRSKLSVTSDFNAMVEAGFEALAQQARTQYGQEFVALDLERKTAALRAVESAQPFFLVVLLLHVYTGYYQQPDVLEAIGYPARPPFPKGYAVTVDDSALLAKLRERSRRRANAADDSSG
jgi:hypothetical protein